MSGSFTSTLESYSIARTQEAFPKRQEQLKGVCPFMSFALTPMSGCARSNGITGELRLEEQAECNKLNPCPSRFMFTLKPGSCLINSANFFASPLWTAASMMHPHKDRMKLTLRVERRKKEGETVFLTLTCVSGCCVCVRVRVRVIVCHSFVWRETRFSSATDNNKTRDTGGGR